MDVLYQVGLVLMLLFLPWWNLGISIAGFWIIGCWLIKGGLLVFRKNPAKLKVAPAMLWGMIAISGLFALQGLGLMWTEDMSFGLRDMRIKLPLLFVPITMTLFPTLRKARWKAIWGAFALSVTAMIMFALWHYYQLGSEADPRVAFTRQSHIRSGQMLAIVYWGLLILAIKERKWILTLPVLVLSYAAIQLQMATAIISIVFVGVLVMFWYGLSGKRWVRRWGPVTISLGVVGIVVLAMWARPHLTATAPLTMTEKSAKGTEYFHILDNKQVENGAYVHRHIAWRELEPAWSIISEQPYSDTIEATLLRYLTALHLKKDASSIALLDSLDVIYIAQGIPNPIVVEGNPLEKRLYRIFNQWNMYRASGNPTGYSFVQRLYYQDAACTLISQQPWTGYGTGDTQMAFDNHYEEIKSPLTKRWRLRSHNQYLAMGVAMGLPLMLFFIFGLIWPGIKAGRWSLLSFWVVMGVFLLGFLSEDTLETQVGVTLFSILYIVVLYFREASILDSSISNTD